MNRAPIAAVALIAAACGGTQPPEPALDEIAHGDSLTVRVAYGQTVRVDGIGLTLEAVPEDSRCAVDVTCVWAGNGRVSLRLQAEGRDRRVDLNTTLEPHAVDFAEHTVRLDSLTPERRSDRTIRPRDYRAGLTIIRH